MAAMGRRVKMCGVEFVQYKSELKVEGSGGCQSISVLGRLRLRKRQQILGTFIFTKIPAWNSEVLVLLGNMVDGNPNFKDKDFCLDLEVDKIKYRRRNAGILLGEVQEGTHEQAGVVD
jgi:hypothetical protein